MFKPSDIQLITPPLTLADFDLTDPAYSIESKEYYEKKLKKRQKSILQVQQAYYHQKQRAIIVLQGWDASGKGGAIRRLTEKLDPRGYKVHPIAAPRPEEQGRHYLYRFQTRLPIPGTWSIFDRSWYERVLVERIEEYATTKEWQRAYQEINEYERMLTDDGVRIVKIFLHISKEEQLNRFRERIHNPYKQWKITSEDLRNRDKWKEYEIATNDMLKYTSTLSSPWHVIPSNKKWYTRLKVLKTVYKALSDGIDLTPPPLDEELSRTTEEQLGIKSK